MSASHAFAIAPDPTPVKRQKLGDATAALGIAAQLSRLSSLLADDHTTLDDQLLPAALRLVCGLFPAVSSASLVRYDKHGRAVTACSSDEIPVLDTLQDALGKGPCWDAHELDMLTIMSSWTAETRWPRLAAQAPAAGSRVESLVSVPLTAGGHPELVLNLYAGATGVFDGVALHTVTLAAAGLALVITALDERTQIEHLKQALLSNRRIGAAIGVIMTSLHCTEDEAFTMLRTVSQHSHVKLRSVADEVLYTGALPELPRSA